MPTRWKVDTHDIELTGETPIGPLPGIRIVWPDILKRLPATED